MKEIFVRMAEIKDAPQFDNWVKRAQEYNGFDATVMAYPTTKTLVAHNGEALVYMPVQTTLTMESLASNPSISLLEKALALKELTKATAFLASQSGIKEIYFLCNDDGLEKLANAHGYETMPYKALRMKV